MLQLQDITLTLEDSGRTLIKDFSFTLRPGDRAVIIGEEGNGKSTLLKYIYDRTLIEPWCHGSGQVITKGKLAYLPQLLPAGLYGTTLAEYFDGTAYYCHYDLLDRMGTEPEQLFENRALGSLSGGERVRMQLLRLLLDEPDILLLDEPTNDLDIATLEWLEDFLNTALQPVLFISHDETLIENTANVIIHIEQLFHKTQTRITVARTPYREYLARRGALMEHQNQVAFKQRAEHEKQMQRWQQIHDKVEHRQRTVSRGSPSEGRLLKKKMHAVLSTGRRLEREAESFTDFAHSEEAILARFDESICLPAGKAVAELNLDSLCAGTQELATGVRLTVFGGEKVGITGPNGAGKSTLLRFLWEQLRYRRDITAAWMPQDYRDVLPYDRSPIQFLSRQGDKAESVLLHNRLASMRFTYGEMNGPIGALSGGQQAKLLFLDMVLAGANVLLLDEPTRNFSPLSAPVVRDAIGRFGGTVISVSHDRKFLSEVCQTVYELTPHGLEKRTFRL